MSNIDRRLAQILRVAPQRWILGAGGVAIAVAASLVAGASGGGQSLLVTVVVLATATGSVWRPATHTALGVIVVVTGQWLVTTDDTLSPWAMGVAALLITFHTIVALLAAVPVTAAVDRAIAARWRRRWAAAVGSAGAMWLGVLLMDQRRAEGSVALTFAGFAAATVLVAALRTRRRPATGTE